MAARRYSAFKERKVSSTGRGASTGGRGGNTPSLPKESAPGRPSSKGMTASNRGLGMKLVKTFVAGKYMKGNPGNLLFGDPGPGAGTTPRFGGRPLPPVVVGGREPMPARRAQMRASRAALPQMMMNRRRGMV